MRVMAVKDNWTHPYNKVRKMDIGKEGVTTEGHLVSHHDALVGKVSARWRASRLAIHYKGLDRS